MAERIMQSNIKKIATIVFIFFASLVLVKGTAMAASNTLSDGQYQETTASVPKQMLNEKFRIPDTEIPILQDAALGGGGGDALKLADFYQYYLGDYKTGMYWLAISAENGDTLGMYNLAVMSAITGGKKGKIRARF